MVGVMVRFARLSGAMLVQGIGSVLGERMAPLADLV